MPEIENEIADVTIRAAMQVAKQVYAQTAAEIGGSELMEMATTAREAFEAPVPDGLIAFLAIGMLAFAPHVEEINGVRQIRAVADAAVRDPQIYEALNAAGMAAGKAFAETIREDSSH